MLQQMQEFLTQDVPFEIQQCEAAVECFQEKFAAADGPCSNCKQKIRDSWEQDQLIPQMQKRNFDWAPVVQDVLIPVFRTSAHIGGCFVCFEEDQMNTRVKPTI